MQPRRSGNRHRWWGSVLTDTTVAVECRRSSIQKFSKGTTCVAYAQGRTTILVVVRPHAPDLCHSLVSEGAQSGVMWGYS